MNNSTPDSIPKWIKKNHCNWEKIEDCYNELNSEEDIRKYLIQSTSEHQVDYDHRVKLAVYCGKLNDTINSYAAMLSDWELTQETDRLIQELSSVDSDRNTLKSFLQQADINALTYGFNLIFISPSENISLENINPFDIRCPRIETIDGQRYLTRLGIKRTLIVDDGDFGEKSVTQWWVYDRGELTVYEKDDGHKFYIVEGYPIPITDAMGRTVYEVPVVWYSITPSQFLNIPVPPFLYLTNLSLKHLNKVSELDNIETKCNCPTWARKHPSSVPENPPALYIGANNVIEVPENGDIYLIEPTGTAIAITHQRIKDLEEEMQKVSIAFLSGGEAEKTATQSIIEAGQSKASLQGMSYQKEIVTQQLFHWIMRFSTPLYDFNQSYGSIKVNIDIKSAPNAQDVGAIANSWSMGLFSRKYALIKLKELGYQPQDINLEEELSNESNPELLR